jgi:serine/threonine protein phosphatase 1
MRKKIFAISDLHGFYNETMAALSAAGWDENNIDHLLVVVGDMFDRGPDSDVLYAKLRDLTLTGKAIVLAGNHEPFLIEWLSGPVSMFNFMYNGLTSTLDSFLGRTRAFFSWVVVDKQLNEKELSAEDWNALWYEWSAIARAEINTQYPELLVWLNSLPDYLETANHIFTHGSIQSYGDWKKPHKGWNWQHWDKGEFFGENIISTDKTVVVGHFGTGDIREKYALGSKDDYSILKREDGRVIMIDGCTVLTHNVNVLILEDDLLE